MTMADGAIIRQSLLDCSERAGPEGMGADYRMFPSPGSASFGEGLAGPRQL